MLTIKNNEEVYSAPECTIISVKVHGVLCASPGGAGDDDPYGENDGADIN